ncbi:hypothetical protein [Streptomyces griseus]|uniref:hypothetical protein n=1 Tax=Streptomyces griseus TaxID=1911 RepID=UPI00056177A8|nr:hypothetical protein [Streptomyces griseus]
MRKSRTFAHTLAGTALLLLLLPLAVDAGQYTGDLPWTGISAQGSGAQDDLPWTGIGERGSGTQGDLPWT